MIIEIASRYYNTIKHLTAEQLYWQLRYRVYRKKNVSNCVCNLRAPVSSEYYWHNKTAFIDASTLKLINIETQYKVPELWNDRSHDDLWLYNVHYFDYLLNPDVNEKIKQKIVYQWVSNNRDCASIGWDAYPLSLRVVNWIKWSLQSGFTDEKVSQSIYRQLSYLVNNLELHISGNHLLANITAIIIGGLFFDTSESLGWYQKGLKLLGRELNNQILDNGGHYELSPMYHNIILEDLIDIYHFHQIYDVKFDIDIAPIIKKMLDWSDSMSHPDGEVAFFNDSAIGVSKIYAQLKSYALSCGIKYAAKQNEVVNCDGYLVVRKGDFDLKFDAAAIGSSSQPGHAHADTLSFELSVAGQRVFVNSGTSTYHDEKLRMLQRSTAPHNTILLDNVDSSIVWSKFRVAKRARIIESSVNSSNDSVCISAAHDGYKNLYGNLIHKRTLEINCDVFLLKDEALGCGEHEVKIMFFLHPNISVKSIDNNTCELEFGSKLLVQSSHKINIIDSQYYPEFNSACANKAIMINYNGSIPFENHIIIKVL